MAANTIPRFTGAPHAFEGVRVTAANTSSAGGGTIGTDIFKLFQASSTEGTFVELVRWMPISSVAATATAATTGRIFWSSVTSGATTNDNTFLIDEVALIAQTAAHSTNAILWFDRPVGIWVPASHTLLCTNHVAPNANTNWRAVPIAGDY